MDPAEILGPDGSIARRLPSYEHRQQQLEMATSVADALRSRKHLIVEAGTGVGKSFAYLVPAILDATAGQESGGKTKRIIVSTHTISLQEQLMSKDLPLLNSVIPREFSAVLVKGRGNYISLRRLENALARSTTLFDREEQMAQLRDIRDWSKQTNDGSRADLSYRPIPAVWDEIASDSGNCMGRKCPQHKNCFYYAARRRQEHAQILVVNHALFFSDLGLRRLGISILPDYDAVILDEAHTVEAVAGDHLGLRIGSGQVDYILNKLYNDRTQKGLLCHEKYQASQQLVDRCRYLADDFFREVGVWQETKGQSNGRVKEAGIVANPLSPELTKLAKRVRDHAHEFKDESLKKDFTSASDRLTALSDELEGWRKQRISDAVYWIEQFNSRRGFTRTQLAAAPIEVAAELRDQLFSQVDTVVLTSATLAVGGNDTFDFVKSRLGVTQAATKRLGSPFNYREQAKLVIVRGMPEPSDKVDYQRLCTAMIQRYVAQTDGHAFVLFTSYDMLRKTASGLTRWLAENDLALFSQADDLPRHEMLQRFRDNPRSVLLGTDSFWQGVDVPGDALQNVIITKLPFSVPDQPLLQARLERIKENGGNPFREYQLPEAVIKFRQGFGRLIRTQQDRGMVVVLDPRIRSKFYGKVFIESLPECEIIEDTVAAQKLS